jgi:hypothetical protein
MPSYEADRVVVRAVLGGEPWRLGSTPRTEVQKPHVVPRTLPRHRTCCRREDERLGPVLHVLLNPVDDVLTPISCTNHRDGRERCGRRRHRRTPRPPRCSTGWPACSVPHARGAVPARGRQGAFRRFGFRFRLQRTLTDTQHRGKGATSPQLETRRGPMGSVPQRSRPRDSGAALVIKHLNGGLHHRPRVHHCDSPRAIAGPRHNDRCHGHSRAVAFLSWQRRGR